MKITHEFAVTRPVEAVWGFFQDVPAVAQCLPGAELTADKGNNTYGGKVSVKLGPLTAVFEGDAVVTSNSQAHTAVIDGTGVDRRGGSRGHVKVSYALVDLDGSTKVDIDADVQLSGAAAQFGRTGLINEMTTRLIDDFVACLEAKLAAPTLDEAMAISNPTHVRGLSFFWASLQAWLRRLFRGRAP